MGNSLTYEKKRYELTNVGINQNVTFSGFILTNTSTSIQFD